MLHKISLVHIRILDSYTQWDFAARISHPLRKGTSILKNLKEKMGWVIIDLKSIAGPFTTVYWMYFWWAVSAKKFNFLFTWAESRISIILKRIAHFLFLLIKDMFYTPGFEETKSFQIKYHSTLTSIWYWNLKNASSGLYLSSLKCTSKERQNKTIRSVSGDIFFHHKMRNIRGAPMKIPTYQDELWLHNYLWNKQHFDS